MQTDDTERARVKLMKYRTLIWTSYALGVKLLTIEKSATGEDELAICREIAMRKVFVVSTGFWDRVWRELAQNAVTAAENRPVCIFVRHIVVSRE